MIRKIQKYLLCENPIRNKDLELFIYSSREGKRALIEVKMLEISDLVNSPETNQAYTLFFTSKETGLPEFHELTIFDNRDIPGNEILNVLKDAGKWFKNYLIWEEKQIFEGKTHEPVIKDYNVKIKDLKIIYSNIYKKFLVIFKEKIMAFDTETDMDKWLLNDMNVNEDDFVKGIINKI